MTLVACAAACSTKPPPMPPKAPNNELIVGEFERRHQEAKTAARFTKEGYVTLASKADELDSKAIASGTYKLDGVCKGIVLIGKAAPLIRDAAAGHKVGYPVVDATDMHDAVRRATELCTAGDAVVLSPACASYDMFQNFGHRGRVFREAVSAVGAKRLDV